MIFTPAMATAPTPKLDELVGICTSLAPQLAEHIISAYLHAILAAVQLNVDGSFHLSISQQP